MLPSDSLMSCLHSLLDILQYSSRICNWLSLWRLVSWINHLPPVCWSTFWTRIRLGNGLSPCNKIIHRCGHLKCDLPPPNGFKKIYGNFSCKINNISFNMSRLNKNMASLVAIPGTTIHVPFLASCLIYGCPMMTSSNGNIFRVTGPLCGNSHTKAIEAELWCFLWSAHE